MEYDDNGNPDPAPSPMERAASLFAALDRNNDGSLTRSDRQPFIMELPRKEFVTGYTQRHLILRRQDADEQKRKLTCLLLFGPHVNREVGRCGWQSNQPQSQIGSLGVISFVCGLLAARAGQQVMEAPPSMFSFSAGMPGGYCLCRGQVPGDKETHFCQVSALVF